MKEFVLVEFLISDNEEYKLLETLGDDFVLLTVKDEWERDDDFSDTYKRVTGKINSMTASMIKLQTPRLADRMRISYISDELKNKYRR